MASGDPQLVELGTPTVSRRARRRREAPRRVGDVKEAALLDVARALVQDGDYNATPINQIAASAGVSRQGFYFYYKSKDELLGQLVTELLYESQPWRAMLQDDDWRDPAAVTRRLTVDTVAMWRRNREVFAAAMEVAPRSEAVLAAWTAAVEENADVLAELVVEATPHESLRDDGAAKRMVVSLIWLIERNSYMHVIYESDESDASFAERIAHIWNRALGFE